MALGKKTGGRQKGTRNKKTLATERQREEMRKKGLDPKDYVIACLNDPEQFDAIQYKAAIDLMPYYYPKLANIDMTAVHGFKKGASLTVNLVPKADDAD